MVKLKFTSAPRAYQTDTADIRRWSSESGAYVVAEIANRYGLPLRYLAIHLDAGGVEFIIGRFRAKNPAERRCRKHYKETAASLRQSGRLFAV